MEKGAGQCLGAPRLEAALLGSRDRKTRESAARVVYDVFALSLGSWAGWTVRVWDVCPGLWTSLRSSSRPQR